MFIVLSERIKFTYKKLASSTSWKSYEVTLMVPASLNGSFTLVGSSLTKIFYIEFFLI